MYLEQDGQCAICKKYWAEKEYSEEWSNPIARLAVDHNHTTGKVRGLLCVNCNTALGSFMDSIEFLESAVKYLKERT